MNSTIRRLLTRLNILNGQRGIDNALAWFTKAEQQIERSIDQLGHEFVARIDENQKLRARIEKNTKANDENTAQLIRAQRVIQRIRALTE